MQEDFIKLKKLLTEDEFTNLYTSMGISFDDLEEDELLKYRDVIYNKFFSFLDKYHSEEILEAILKRRDIAIQNMEKYIQEIKEKREEENKVL